MELLIKSKRHGKYTVFFDEQDSELILRHKWCITKADCGYYAQTAIVIDGKQRRVEMHRLIMGSQPGKLIDHKDRNGLNNRRSNLRFCTPSQNRCNTRGKINSRTGYKGVFTAAQTKNFRAQIRMAGKTIHGGMFKTPAEAAARYNELALQYFGEFACLNEIPNQNAHGSTSKQPAGTN